MCKYVPPQKMQIDSPQTAILFDAVAAVSIADVSHTSRPNRIGQRLKLEPPLRLHLMHQILLV